MNKDCSYYRDLFPAYLEGKLGAETRREIAAHLNECAACAADFSQEWRSSIDDGSPHPGADRVQRVRRPGFLSLKGKGTKVHLGIVLLLAAFLFYLNNTRNLPAQSETTTTTAPAGREPFYRLADALVSLRRDYPTTDLVSGREQVKVQVFTFLDRLEAALVDLARKSDQQDWSALADLLHQDCRFTLASSQGGESQGLGRKELLTPEGALRLAGRVGHWRHIRWWDWEEGLLSLWVRGRRAGVGTLVVLKLGTPGCWQLYYVNSQNPGD